MLINPISFTSNNRSYVRTSADKKIKDTNCFTQMFRDDFPWNEFADYLQEHFKNARRVEVINQACSDGSEPFSLVIVLQEKLNQSEAEKFFPIYAYDYDEEVMQNAKNGRIYFSAVDYPRFNHMKLNKEKYFEYKGYDRHLALHSYDISDNLRKNVVFNSKSVLETLGKMPNYKTDCIFICRNMYPYLSFYEMDNFRELLCKKLGVGSIVAFGNYDMDNFGSLIKGDLIRAGFAPALDGCNVIFAREHVRL